MTHPADSKIATYTENSDNFKADSDVRVVGSVYTATEADTPHKFVADDGIVVPTRTTAQIDAISSPQDGAIIHDSTIDFFKFYFQGAWQLFKYSDYEEDNTQATTTSTTPQLIFTSTFTTPAPGEYFLSSLYAWGSEKKDKSHIVRIDLDDAEIDEFEQYMGGEDDNADTNIPSTWRSKHTLTAATHTLKMYLSSGEVGKEVFVNDKTFIVEYSEA